jgi:hypothetical protein
MNQNICPTCKQPSTQTLFSPSNDLKGLQSMQINNANTITIQYIYCYPSTVAPDKTSETEINDTPISGQNPKSIWEIFNLVVLTVDIVQVIQAIITVIGGVQDNLMR